MAKNVYLITRRGRGYRMSKTPPQQGEYGVSFETKKGLAWGVDTIQGGGVVPAVFTMTQLASSQKIYQRSAKVGGGQGKGYGTIPIGVNVTGAGTIFARIRASDGSTILQAPWLVSGNISTGAQTVQITGIDARLGWFYLDLSGDGNVWQNGSVLVGMGKDTVIGYSQSLGVRMFGRMDGQSTTMASLGVAISPYGSVYATYADGQKTVSTPHWAIPADGSDYDSTFAAEYLRREIEKEGVNCGLVGHAVGATAIASWLPGQANNTQLKNVVAEIGGFEALVVIIGHSDAGGGTSGTVFANRLTQVRADAASINFLANFDMILTTIPNINSASWGTPEQRETIRQSALEWSKANGAIYRQPMTFELTDGVHQSQVDNVKLGAIYSFALHGVAYPGLNLTMTSPVYSSGASGYGQQLTGGYGVTVAGGDTIPIGQTWTLEAWVSNTGAPGSVKVIAGENIKGWFGINGAGRLIANFRDINEADVYIGTSDAGTEGTNPLLIDGVRHHVAMVVTPTVQRLYLDGVQVATASGTPKQGIGDSIFAVRNYGGSLGYEWPGSVDEFAVWNGEQYKTNFTPSGPKLGTENGLAALWHLDGNGYSAGYIPPPPFDTATLAGLALLHRKDGYVAATGTWDDISPVNRDSVQATAGSRPTADAAGGISCTSTQKIPSTLPADASIEYGWAVVTFPVLTGSQKTILGTTAGSGNGGRQLRVGTDGGPSLMRQGAGAQVFGAGGSILAATKQLIEWISIISSSQQSSIIVDATQVGGSAAATAFAAGTTSFVGGNASGENMVGSIHEIGVVQGQVPDAATRQLIQGRVAWDHGIQSRLPSGHPYKNAAPL